MLKEIQNNFTPISKGTAIGVDADSIHSLIKEIILNNALKKNIETVFVSDRKLKDIQSFHDKYKANVKNIIVTQGEDAADDYLYNNSDQFFLVITHDIPLSERLIKKGVSVISERGEKLNNDNIREFVSVRNVMNTMRDYGIYEKKGQKHPITQKDVKQFADAFNEVVTKYLNAKNKQ